MSCDVKSFRLNCHHVQWHHNADVDTKALAIMDATHLGVEQDDVACEVRGDVRLQEQLEDEELFSRCR